MPKKKSTFCERSCVRSLIFVTGSTRWDAKKYIFRRYILIRVFFTCMPHSTSCSSRSASCPSLSKKVKMKKRFLTNKSNTTQSGDVLHQSKCVETAFKIKKVNQTPVLQRLKLATLRELNRAKNLSRTTSHAPRPTASSWRQTKRLQKLPNSESAVHTLEVSPVLEKRGCLRPHIETQKKPRNNKILWHIFVDTKAESKSTPQPAPRVRTPINRKEDSKKDTELHRAQHRPQPFKPSLVTVVENSDQAADVARVSPSNNKYSPIAKRQPFKPSFASVIDKSDQAHATDDRIRVRNDIPLNTKFSPIITPCNAFTFRNPSGSGKKKLPAL